MATINVGRVRPVHRGAWSSSVKYDFFDFVTSGGSSYLCINTSGAPANTAVTNTTYWALIAQKGDTGPQGKTGAAGPAGAAGKAGTAATITIGTVTTGAAGSQAKVENVGSASAAKLNFTIPQGARGATGPSGVYTGPMKPSAGNWVGFYYNSGDHAKVYKLPSGGTWAYFTGVGTTAGVAAGGTQIISASYYCGFCWRIA